MTQIVICRRRMWT